MELNAKSSGRHVFFVAGTGLLPILDFIFFLFRKTIYTIAKEKGGADAAKKVNVYNEPFDLVFSTDFTVEIYGSFPSIKECLGFELIKRLCIINSQMKDPTFKAFFKFSNGDKDFDVECLNGRLTQELVENILGKNMPERIYVCGPPQFNEDVPEFAKRNGFPQDKIIRI